jgi:hypothetical protein
MMKKVETETQLSYDIDISTLIVIEPNMNDCDMEKTFDREQLNAVKLSRLFIVPKLFRGLRQCFCENIARNRGCFQRRSTIFRSTQKLNGIVM